MSEPTVPQLDRKPKTAAEAAVWHAHFHEGYGRQDCRFIANTRSRFRAIFAIIGGMEWSSDLRAFHTYMVVEKHLSPRTGLEYCRDIERFERDQKARDKTLNEAKTKHIRRWLLSLQIPNAEGKPKNQPQSIHRKIAAMCAYFKWLKREKRRKDNPVEEIEKPKCDKRLPVFLSCEEVEAVINAKVPRRDHLLELRDKAMLCTMYGSGLRRAEVCHLSIRDINLEQRTAKVFGKGAKERVVFLAGVAIERLCEYLNARGDVLQGSDPLFLGQRGDRMTVRNLWAVFRDHREAAALDKHYTPHTFRHSFASHMLANGADIVTIKELLGHSNISTTDRYSHVTIDHMREKYEACHPHALVPALPA